MRGIADIIISTVCLLALPMTASACTDNIADDGVVQTVPETGGEDGESDGTGPVRDPAIAYSVADRLGIGWNLGNQLDAYSETAPGEYTASETAWGNSVATQSVFDAVKTAGFSSVRVPVTWLGHFGPDPDYNIDDAWLDRVAEVVGYAESAGLNVIINIHHDGAEGEHWLDIGEAALNPVVNDRIIRQITAMWTQIAEKFRDSGDFLIFEGFNEIHDGGWGWGANRTDNGRQYAVLDTWNQTFVDAVRATGGNNSTRWLAVPGYCTNPDLTIEHMELPDDTAENRLMVSVHYYDPNTYTLTAEYSEWGHTADPDRRAGDNEEEHVRTVFGALNEAFVGKGIPVYLGEIGCVNRAEARDQAFQQYWFEYVVKAAKTYGMAAFVWDNGARGTGNEQHGFIDHATGEFCSEPARLAVETMTRAMNDDDTSYTLETVYGNAPSNGVEK